MGVMVPGIGSRNGHRYANSAGSSNYLRQPKEELGDVKPDMSDCYIHADARVAYDNLIVTMKLRFITLQN